MVFACCLISKLLQKHNKRFELTRRFGLLRAPFFLLRCKEARMNFTATNLTSLTHKNSLLLISERSEMAGWHQSGRVLKILEAFTQPTLSHLTATQVEILKKNLLPIKPQTLQTNKIESSPWPPPQLPLAICCPVLAGTTAVKQRSTHRQTHKQITEVNTMELLI